MCGPRTGEREPVARKADKDDCHPGPPYNNRKNGHYRQTQRPATGACSSGDWKGRKLSRCFKPLKVL